MLYDGLVDRDLANAWAHKKEKMPVVLEGEEGYKTRIHAMARRRMAAETWAAEDVGTGKILAPMVQAIAVPGNNLLAIDDRNGPDTRAQFPLEKALADGRTGEMERFFLDLYALADPPDDEWLFSRAVEHFGRSYPLIGYLFFLRDIDRFTPLRPKGLQALNKRDAVRTDNSFLHGL